MPELIHGCGKKVRFPSGLAGKRGRCPHCGGPIQVPGEDQAPPQHAHRLDPPPHWDEWLAYLNGGPPPRPMVMPQKLMLQTEADEAWQRQAEVRPSKYFCPACKERMNVDQVLCTKCGLDFRTGHVLGKNQKLSEKGMNYLKDIPWLVEARKALKAEQKAERTRAKTAKIKRRSGTSRLAKATRRRKRFR